MTGTGFSFTIMDTTCVRVFVWGIQPTILKHVLNYENQKEITMHQTFSWQNFNRMSKALESIGYIVLVFGPILGLSIVIFGSTMFRLVGIIIIFASFLIAMYHFCFSLMMHGIAVLKLQLDSSMRRGAKRHSDKTNVTAAGTKEL